MWAPGNGPLWHIITSSCCPPPPPSPRAAVEERSPPPVGRCSVGPSPSAGGALWTAVRRGGGGGAALWTGGRGGRRLRSETGVTVFVTFVRLCCCGAGGLEGRWPGHPPPPKCSGCGTTGGGRLALYKDETSWDRAERHLMMRSSPPPSPSPPAPQSPPPLSPPAPRARVEGTGGWV